MSVGFSLRRFGRALFLVAVVGVVVPAAASAHLRSGTVGTGYRASVEVPSRLRAALAARIYESDRALRLRARGGHTVVVEGYLGEPVLRIDAAGVAVNRASPTAVSAGLLPKREQVSGQRPDWSLRSSRRDVVWHDARTRGLPVGVARGAWSVPLTVDGSRFQLSGEIWRVPRPSLVPWLALVVSFVLATIVCVLGRRRLPLRSACLVFGLLAAAAAAVTAAGFALDSYASPGSWVAGGDEAVFLAVGVGVLLRGPRHAQGPAAVGLGLLGLFVGASRGAVFAQGVVLSALPGTDIRTAVALTLAASIGAIVCGGVLVAATPWASVSGPVPAQAHGSAPVSGGRSWLAPADHDDRGYDHPEDART